MSQKLEDPPRLTTLDGVFSDLQSLLERAQKDVLPDAQLEQLVNSFERRVAAGPLEPSHVSLEAAEPSRASDAVGFRAWIKTPRGKISVTLAVLGLGATATVGVLGSREGAVASVSPSAQLTFVPPNRHGVSTATPEIASNGPREEHLTEAPQPSAHTPPSPSAASRSVTSPSAASPSAASRSATSPSAASRSVTSPSAVAAGAAASGVVANAENADEFRLVRAARQAAATDPNRALALAQEHLGKFPNGMLSQERETIAIESLMRLGNRAGAQKRAVRFLAAFPTSPYAKRIRAAVGSLPRSEER